MHLLLKFVGHDGIILKIASTLIKYFQAFQWRYYFLALLKIQDIYEDDDKVASIQLSMFLHRHRHKQKYADIY